MNVSAIVVTRGDVDTDEVVNSLPTEWETLLWDNGARKLTIWDGEETSTWPDEIDAQDLSVYGRYAAIEYATHDLIYVQDDDVIVSDPQAIVDEWVRATETDEIQDSTWWPDSLVVANMPQEFRHDFYREHCLVGFGACFHCDLPARAFERYHRFIGRGTEVSLPWPLGQAPVWVSDASPQFLRTCDVIFTALTPRVLVDIPRTNLPHATADNRMYRQASHQAERGRALKLALECRNG